MIYVEDRIINAKVNIRVNTAQENTIISGNLVSKQESCKRGENYKYNFNNIGPAISCREKMSSGNVIKNEASQEAKTSSVQTL